MSRKESLVRGAAALAVAGLVIKVSNLLVRIPLTRLIDSEGLGIYQIALPAFFALFHIAAGRWRCRTSWLNIWPRAGALSLNR